VDLADITAVIVHIEGRRLIVVSIYIPDLCSRRTKEENLKELSSRLKATSKLIQEERLCNLHIEAIIADDFNRHNPL
jgi:hypothetical protein